MDAKLVLGTGFLNRTYITSVYFIAGVLVFGAVASKIDIVWLHAVPLSFQPQRNIYQWNLCERVWYFKNIL